MQNGERKRKIPCTPRILYPAKLSFKKNEGKIKKFHNTQTEFIASRPTLQKTLQEVLSLKGNDTRW